MDVKVQADDTQLSKLVEAVERGEDVVLARDEVPVARIVPIRPKPFRYGIIEHLVKGPVPEFEPMTDEELDQLEREKDERIARGLA